MPVAGKAATFVVLAALAFGAQDPPAAEKPKPGPPTIRLALTRLKPDIAIETGGDPAMTAGDDAVWVLSSKEGTLSKIDVKTNKTVGTVAVGKEPCAGLSVGFGTVLVPLCSGPGLARVDLKTNAVTTIAKTLTATIGAPATGVGSIWVITDARGTLARIDPTSNGVVAEIDLGAAGVALAFGNGAVWVATASDELLRLDPYTNVTVEAIKVGKAPRSIAIGEGAIWTLNVGDDSVSRVDPKTNKVVSTIKLGVPVTTGQIIAGEGSVWVTSPGAPLFRIDPRTNRVIQQFTGQGGGAILAAHGSIWLTISPKIIWRLDPKLIEATR